MALLIGILAAMAFWYITRSVSDMPEVKIGKVLAGGEEMAIQRVELLEKKNNRPTMRLNAEKASFSGDRKRIKLSNFSLVSYGESSGTITISAGEGTLNGDSNDGSAEGGVLVMDQDGRALYSEKLRWTSAGKTLVSDSPARIFGENFLIKGNRLSVDMERGKARLSEGVVAIFQNNQNK